MIIQKPSRSTKGFKLVDVSLTEKALKAFSFPKNVSRFEGRHFLTASLKSIVYAVLLEKWLPNDLSDFLHKSQFQFKGGERTHEK